MPHGPDSPFQLGCSTSGKVGDARKYPRSLMCRLLSMSLTLDSPGMIYLLVRTRSQFQCRKMTSRQPKTTSFKQLSTRSVWDSMVSRCTQETAISLINFTTAIVSLLTAIHDEDTIYPNSHLSTIVNLRDDEYGRDIEGRSKFTLETVQKLCNAIGAGRVAVRLSPFGLFNETLGEERIPQWQYLCTQLGQMGLAYV